MVVICGVVHKVFAAASVAVQCEQKLVRLLVVVVLRHGDEVIAGIAAHLDLEFLAVFDLLHGLQGGIGAAALARGRGVFQGVTEFVRRLGLLEFHVECRVERAERDGKRVETFGDKADGFVLGGLF